MMQRLIFAATALLFIQIVLVVVININSTSLDSVEANSPFVSFNGDGVTSIAITGTQGEMFTLQRKDSGWILPGSFSVPASEALVNELLGKLAAANRGMMVATTAGAAKRFRTTTDDFERHLVLKEGDRVVVDFYLGTSAGYRHSHVRKADQEEVVSIAISNFEIEEDKDKWVDQTIARVAKDEIKRLELGEIILNRNDNDWSVVGLAAEQTVTEEVEKLLEKVTGITIKSPIDPKEVSSLFESQPDTRLNVTTSDGTERNYSFVRQDDYYVLKISTSEFFFRVDTWQVDELLEITYDTLAGNKGDGVRNSTEGQQ